MGDAMAETHKTYATPAAMIDGEWLQPHNSEITGAMVQNVWRWYGVPPHILLSIIAAESSMGDPVLGGRLISEGHHNYGCLRFGIHPKCDELATGCVTVGGKDWYSFPSMQNGMMALGRYLKVGPTSNPGYYMRCFASNRGWCEPFARVYYGAKVPRFAAYVETLRRTDQKLIDTALKYGFSW